MNNDISPMFSTHYGVRQGCILSPNLFNLFINDIPDIFDETCMHATLGQRKLNCIMYADDLVLISESSNGLQNCLNKLYNYTTKWGLKVNLKKTKILTFQKSKKKRIILFWI